MINAIVAIGQVPWETQFVSGLTHPMTGIQVQRRCVDAVDVLAVTKVISTDVVIISDHTLRLDEEFLAQLTRQQVRVIALTANPKFFENLGIIECLQIDPANPLAAIPLLAAMVRVNKVTDSPELIPKGELIFIGGFAGGTGKTRSAMEIAYALAAKEKQTLLVDGDTYGPCLSQLLNQLPTQQGLLDVCRKIERKTAQGDFLVQDAIEYSQFLHFLPGLVKPSRWVDLRSAVLHELWQFATAQFDYVIVDAGPVLEIDPMSAIDTGLPKRNLVSASALSAASKVVLVTRIDEISITRLIKGTIENANSFTNKTVSVLLASGSIKKSGKDAVNAIQVHTDVANVQVIADHQEVMEKAQRQNTFASALNKDVANQYAQIATSIIESVTNSITSSRLARMFSGRHQVVPT